jgi:TM2 domain-containing membrane protein YozV
MNTADLISIRVSDEPVPPPRQKSAGLAWLLSMVVPGAGHFYCGMALRGGVVLGFSVLGMAFLVGAIAQAARGGKPEEVTLGVAILGLPLLYIFGFLDAYFTAREISRGIDPSLVDNPRVACVLNLLTRGFGYFYLGERVKGIIVFVAIGVATTLMPMIVGGGPRAMGVLSVVTYAVLIVIGIDAYRIGERSFNAQVAGLELPPEPPPSHLPAVVPLMVACLIAIAVAGLMLVGMAALLLKGGPG